MKCFNNKYQVFHHLGLSTYPGNLECISKWFKKYLECINAWYEYPISKSQCQKYANLTNSQLICNQMNSLVPGEICTIRLIYKLDNLVNKLVCNLSVFLNILHFFWSVFTKIKYNLYLIFHFAIMWKLVQKLVNLSDRNPYQSYSKHWQQSCDNFGLCITG